MSIRLGTRGSALARAQSQQVADALARVSGEEVQLVEVVTAGDRSTAPIPQLGVGVFVSALRDALLDGSIDLAVHSYKDLPTAQPEELVIAAIPEREDPRDALVARDGLILSELPTGARVGTGSVRRIAQLQSLGLGLVPVPVRGNVDTRLRKVADGELDAVILARAGLVRLGRAEAITEIIDPLMMLPAPAQGALAVECRADNARLAKLLGTLDHAGSRAAVVAERALLATLEAGCSAPVAGYAVQAENEDGDLEIYLRGAVYSTDGLRSIRANRTGTLADAERIGRLLAADLLDEGAADLIAPSPDGDGAPQLGVQA
jgi:hydroxymethylbilane synthase